jgi:hypothetical protein
MRLRRRLPMTFASERAGISRSTLYKVERGDPGVGLGTYAAVLHGYGMLERLEELVDPRADRAGLAMDVSRLPRRIRP